MAAAHDVSTLPIDLLVESKSNPRKTWGNLEELVESIRKVGVLQSLLVRPVGTSEEKFEIVFGHRRFRAAKLAGVSIVPVNVRTLSDQEVLEMQLIENLHREDVHPLEEAEAYEQLHERYGVSAEEIAAKIGKSKGYVYQRMKLCALAPAARKAFYEGSLSAATALYVARIPNAKLQLEAIKEIGPVCRGDEPMSAREARRVIQAKFTLRLADAPFSTTDADLVVRAGSCAQCPKRTGNQRELFSDVAADVCTDPVCFRSKLDAEWKRRVEIAKATGNTKVMPDAEAKKLFPWDGRITHDSEYVDLDEEHYGEGKTRKVRAILRGATYEVTIARDKDGRIHELAPRKALESAVRRERAAERTKVERATDRKEPKAPETAAEKKLQIEVDKAKADRETRLSGEKKFRAVIQATERACANGVSAIVARVLALALVSEDMFDVVERVLERRGVEAPAGQGVEWLRSMIRSEGSVGVLCGLVLELAVESYAGARGDDVLDEACKMYGIES